MSALFKKKEALEDAGFQQPPGPFGLRLPGLLLNLNCFMFINVEFSMTLSWHIVLLMSRVI